MKCGNRNSCACLTRGAIVAVGAMLFVGCATGGVGKGFGLSGKMPLVDKGKPLVDIVIAPDADKDLRFAADELKLHLDKITGGDFPIVTQPSEGRKGLRIAYNPNLEKQELSISFSNDGVALESGGFPEYAVWDFLRDYCGVKWLDPTDAGTIIPSNTNLAVNRNDRKDKPFAKGRNPGDSHQHHFEERAVFAGCGVRAVGTNESNTYRRTQRKNTVLGSTNQYARVQRRFQKEY